LLGAALTAALLLAVTGGFAQEKAPHADAPKPEPKEAVKPAAVTAARPGVAPQTQVVNDQLTKAWQANSIKPSARASEQEFIRRVYLDLIGRIATPAEVRYFELNRDRARLVHRLLYEKVKIDGKEYDYPEEFARNWANIWTVWLLTRTGNPVYHEQMRVWLEEHFAKNWSHKEMVEKLLTATGKTNDNGAVNYILGNLGEAVPKGKEDEEGHFDVVPLTSRTTRLFLGLQTQCVQCHDHPFNPDWKQHAFWGVNVFFRQVKRDGSPNMMRNNQASAAVMTLGDDSGVNKEGLIAYEKRSGVVLYTKPTFLDGRKIELDAGTALSRREQLAKLVVSSEQFPKAYVNRIWGHLFGRGLNEQPSVDDFGEHNKVVHPELLDYLAKEFASDSSSYPYNQYNAYDPKKLLYWLCTTDAYGLSSVANATNEKPEAEVVVSRMLLKALSPEQLFESLSVATGADNGTSTQEKRKKREEWMKKLTVNFGDDEGNEITFNSTLLQALMMMNGKELGDAIRNKDKGTVAEAMRKGKGSAPRVIDELFLAALNRHPQGYELGKITAAGAKTRDTASFYFFSDVFWALLNSNEFILNH
jgi:hypothetical protein